ncbi:MAG: site-specific integrase [Bauldia sp.]|nr:site-specific integrase [Bauldia sp.]
MSVRKREWKAGSGETKTAWVVDYRDGGGVRRLRTFARKKDADAFAASTSVEVRDGTHVADRATVTVEEAGREWIKTGENSDPPLELSTLDQRRQHLDLHIAPLIGREKLSKLNVPGVRAFQDRLREKGASADMVKRVTVSLGSLFADAQERGVAARNPVAELAKRRGRGRASQGTRRQKKRLEVGVDIPSPAEIGAILRHAKGRYRPLIVTAIFTGMRASEIRGLRWQDVDLKEGKIHIRQRADRYHSARHREAGHNPIGMPKSEDGQRTIPLPPLVSNILREWKLQCPKGELDLVFPTGAGAIEYHSNIVSRGLLPAMLAAGVTVETDERDEAGNPILAPKYTGLHALRHFYASWCINRRADGGLELPPKVVQTRMGHASITMTMDVYGHLFPSTNDAKALAKAERTLFAAVHAT